MPRLYRFLPLLLLLIAASCEPGKSEKPDTTSSENGSKNAIDTNIRGLAQNPWEPDLYHEILTRQIDAAIELEEEDKEPLRKKLAEAYADQLLRCLGSLLENDCASNHAQIQAMNDSLLALRPTLKIYGNYREKECDMAASRVARHNQMLSFYVATSLPASAWQRPYDYSYDSRVRNQALNYRATNPTCEAVKKKISSQTVEENLRRRHEAYDRQVAAHSRDYSAE